MYVLSSRENVQTQLCVCAPHGPRHPVIHSSTTPTHRLPGIVILLQLPISNTSQI